MDDMKSVQASLSKRNYKNIYHFISDSLEAAPQKLDLLKTDIAESLAISKKASIYKKIIWTAEQRKQFDDYWETFYGKKISDRWHRLYQAISGSFSVDYVPEKIYTTKIEPTFNDRRYALIFQDKSLVEMLCKGTECISPETIFVCSKGQFFDSERNPISVKKAASLLEKAGEAVIKPTVGGSSGNGIIFWKSEENIDFKNIIRFQGSDFIVQRRIDQHPIYSAFNYSSINTIRITTYIVNDEIYHIPIALRIGRNGKKVDNIHAGGIGVGVEDDGYLLPKAYELGYGDRTVVHKAHPDSGVLFEGYQLPMIPEIIKTAYKVHCKIPHIGIISWDFSVDGNNNVILIEANIIGQGIWFPQMIHGKGPFGEHTQEVLKRIKK